MTSPVCVANTLILRARQHGSSLTHLKLQKLIYILYARYLAIAGEAMFPERFEAWEHGPVLSGIYQVFKDYGAEPIDGPVAGADGAVWVLVEDGEFGEALDQTWAAFGPLDPERLVELTHEEDSAWSHAKNEHGLGGFLGDMHIKQDGVRWFPGKA